MFFWWWCDFVWLVVGFVNCNGLEIICVWIIFLFGWGVFGVLGGVFFINIGVSGWGVSLGKLVVDCSVDLDWLCFSCLFCKDICFVGVWFLKVDRVVWREVRSCFRVG